MNPGTQKKPNNFSNNSNSSPSGSYPAAQRYTPEQIEYIKRKLYVQEMEKAIPSKSASILGTIVIRPKGTTFGTQNPGEKVFVLVRRHWIANVGWIFRSTLYLFIPFIVAALLPLLVDIINITNNPVPSRIWIIIIVSYYSVVLTLTIRNFVEWFYDLLIVTNQRILDYEFSPFTGYNIKEAALENIEDIKEVSKDFWGGIFRYGDIEATTASSEGKLNFDQVPHVTLVRDILSDLANIAKKYKKNGD